MSLLLDPQVMISLLAFAGGFASIIAIALPFMRRDQRASRLKAVAQRREELSQQQRQDLMRQRSPRRQVTARASAMKKLLERFKLENLAASKGLKQKLAAAGYREQSAVITFIFQQFGFAIGLSLVALFFVSVGETFEFSVLARLIISAVAGVVGWFLPAVLVKNKAQKRQDEMTLNFPDTLDLLVICVESGLAIEPAFARVTEEISESAPVLAQELGLTSAELAFLGDRTKAYANFAGRTGLPAAQSLSTALAQSDKYGTPVSVALKVLAE
jgi:tight adherence protein C